MANALHFLLPFGVVNRIIGDTQTELQNMTRNQIIFLKEALKAIEKANATVIDVWNDPSVVGHEDKDMAEIANAIDSARSRLHEFIHTAKTV